jgi:hypothetical protein
MTNDQSLRKHLVALLAGGHAYSTFDKIIAGFPPELRGEVPKGLSHSGWMLLEHLRLTQWDILEFSRNPKYVTPKGPTITGQRIPLRRAPKRGIKASSRFKVIWKP